MIKKIFFISIILLSTISFSQKKSIDNLSAIPNPFTHFTKINFNSTTNSTIILSVKNVLGKTVFKKVFKTKLGKNSIFFYKEDLSSGMYIYSVQDKKKTISKRLVIR
tara:strand:+ start:3371 stop:3691 length:321 start_codon:yes stop_codon:yes gene_type:complete